MPLNSRPVSRNQVVNTRKYTLCLNKNNAANLKRAVHETVPHLTNDQKENRPVKRPLQGTYQNTLNAAKKLKPLSETTFQSGSVVEATLEVLEPKTSSTAMLNGHNASDNQYGGPQSKTPIATLSNMGNTCFLNSVLYTLRYAPQFVHNLHHLVSDLGRVEQKLGSIRAKSSSLGRSAAGITSSGTRSWSSKDLLSLGQSDNNSAKSKIQVVTEKLHETYVNLRAGESKCINSGSNDSSPEAFAPDPFLSALRDVNSTFEGNRQQDAHELLVCILDNIRETCRALSARASRLQLQENGDSNGLGRAQNIEDGGKTLGNLRKSWKKRKEVKLNDKRTSPTEERAPSPSDPVRDERSQPGWDFVAESFEGTMVVRTMCLECEAVTEKAQAVCELCVPVGEDESAEEPFRAACLSSEYLRDQNKYWCERCLRYNEARRSVAYSRLPRLLVLQLKRFSGGMEKITKYAPTPLLMPCFCEPCAKRPPEHAPTHRYVLWGVIMHFGQTLTGGHYVAYTRDNSQGDLKCERETDNTTTNTGSSFMRTLFNRPRNHQSGCTAKECCVPRQRPEVGWLSCDDDVVKPISNEEFEDLLSPEPKTGSGSTPYLLFYVKSDVD